jgi:hypothetical protein
MHNGMKAYGEVKSYINGRIFPVKFLHIHSTGQWTQYIYGQARLQNTK